MNGPAGGEATPASTWSPRTAPDSCAIQAKAYDPAYRVTKRDVNKFLAESGRAIFKYRMLIATTNLIDRIGERTIQDQEKRVTFFRLNDLQVANVDWPASPTALRPARPRKPARPRDYQREAITKVVNGFTSADRGQLIRACGTGKTLTALFITEKLEATRTLVLVPSLSLLKQTLNVWRANCTTEFASLPVCSDDTVADADEDVALAHTSDLGVPVTTDPLTIRFSGQSRSTILPLTHADTRALSQTAGGRSSTSVCPICVAHRRGQSPCCGNWYRVCGRGRADERFSEP
jgi:predicted helicase